MTKKTAHCRAAVRTAVGLGAVLLTPNVAAAQGGPYQFPFQNPNLPVAQRVNDLVSRMSLPEKAAQMCNDAPAIPRLGIPFYGWWSECLHGDAVGPSTVFPEPMGLASTFDLALEAQVADAISDEDRAHYNETGLVGYPSGFHGLTFFAPNINIFRDPRWGRGQETYGEDPYLTAQFGVTYVKGLQGSDKKYFKVIATPKHYAVHSGPEPERHRFNAVVSNYDLYDTYLPAFQATIEKAHAQSIMGAYSALDGVPDCANPLLLQTNLRDKWGFDGYVVSDCDAVGDIYGGHHFTPSLPAAAAAAVKAGDDLDCGGSYNQLPAAVQQGLVTEAQIDVSVKRLFTARMRLGMFDPAGMVPYDKIPASVIDSPAHRLLARRAADEALVLLKNQNDFLPLHGLKSLAVIGPNADDQGVLRGNYSGSSHHEVTILEGLQKRAATAGVHVEYVQGSGLTSLTNVATVPADALRNGGRPGLHGEYFSNDNLEGAPVAERQDPQIRFTWSGVGPGLKLTQFHYSVRWTGELVAPRDGQYTVGVRGDDGFRLYLNGQKVVDDWSIHPAETRTAVVTLKAGQPVPIRLEYFQGEGDAEVSLVWQEPGQEAFSDAVAAAKRADAVVFVGGISSALESEESGTHIPGFQGGDRTTLDIPSVQQDLLNALYATGKPIVLVLLNGSALSVNWAHGHLPAILEAWYPGEEGGDAVAGALFGDDNPAGRLPVTFYASVNDLPPFEDYAMKGRTYRYFAGTPLYPFGFGLSYTRFSYSGLTVPRRVGSSRNVTVTAQVQNVGSRAGDAVVELYVRPAPNKPEAARWIAPGQPMPRLELAGFRRVTLAARARTTVTFTLMPEQLRLVNAKGARSLQPHAWQVFVGGRQPDPAKLQAGILSQMVTVQ